MLDRLNIPKRPLVHDELQKEEDEDVVVIQPKTEAAGESEEKDEGEEDKGEVTVH